MNNSDYVKKQYADDANLSVRLKLHAKYSTNRQGLVPWLFDIYDFTGAQTILELGCGNAAQWDGNTHRLPQGCRLVLTDLSAGMIEIVQDKFAAKSNISVQKADILNIPFPDGSMDIIIANYMLYHVPDIQSALTEVRRVLRPGGRFYCATNGNGGMRPHLNQALKAIKPDAWAFGSDFAFSLQNGGDLLSKVFDKVTLYEYPDALSITGTQDLIDWIKSAITSSDISDDEYDALYNYFEDIRVKCGAIYIPKETGIFVCIKD